MPRDTFQPREGQPTAHSLLQMAEQFDELTRQAKAANPLVIGADRGIPGIDVSHWQGEIDWDAVVHSGVHFAYIKTSDGVDDEDPRFQENWVNAKRAGILVGGYHFGRPSSITTTAVADATDEANDFIARLQSVDYGPGDLPPALDVEQGGIGATPGRDVIVWVKTFVERIEEVLGVKPVIYTGLPTWKFKLQKVDAATLEHAYAHAVRVAEILDAPGFDLIEHVERSKQGLSYEARFELAWLYATIDEFDAQFDSLLDTVERVKGWEQRILVSELPEPEQRSLLAFGAVARHSAKFWLDAALRAGEFGGPTAPVERARACGRRKRLIKRDAAGAMLGALSAELSGLTGDATATAVGVSACQASGGDPVELGLVSG